MFLRILSVGLWPKFIRSLRSRSADLVDNEGVSPIFMISIPLTSSSYD